MLPALQFLAFLALLLWVLWSYLLPPESSWARRIVFSWAVAVIWWLVWRYALVLR
jgi:hypothetical protein